MVRIICICNHYFVCVLRHIRLFATLWTVAHQVPLSIGFIRQEYWSGLPFPPPGDLPFSGIEPESPVSPELAGRFFNHWATQEALPLTLVFAFLPIFSASVDSSLVLPVTFKISFEQITFWVAVHISLFSSSSCYSAP